MLDPNEVVVAEGCPLRNLDVSGGGSFAGEEERE